MNIHAWNKVFSFREIFGWSYPEVDTYNRESSFAVLEMPMGKSPVTAVRASIVTDSKNEC